MAANDYATIKQLKSYAYQTQDSDDETLKDVLTRASRLFDMAAGCNTGYFAAGDSSQTASARKYWGKGTDYLQLDPYLDSPAITVAMPTGYTVPGYIESKSLPEHTDEQGFYLVRTYGDDESRLNAITQPSLDANRWVIADSAIYDYLGWPDGIKVTVTAKWGWEATPADVTEAVLEMSVAIWRQKDQAFARVTNLETGAIISDPLTPRAKLIADKYKQARGLFA